MYISEVVEQSMNPSFGKIDWSRCGAGITRSEEVIVRIWAQGRARLDWRELLRLGVKLRGLVYLGKSVGDGTARTSDLTD